jgi:hypothetical protein
MPAPADCLVNDPATLKAAMLALIDLVLDEAGPTGEAPFL